MRQDTSNNAPAGDGHQVIFDKALGFSSSIKAVIFDMDGVLIDSEPFWHEAEIAVFRRVGIELTESMCLETTGLRVDEVVNYWYRKHPWKDFVAGALEEKIIDFVIERIVSKGETKEGVKQVLDYLEHQGLKIALASSSSYRIIEAAILRLGIRDKFNCIHSAEEEDYGKPHPAVYLNTALKLGVNPMECLAIEDSFNGVLSAKAARMKCFAVPDPAFRDDVRFIIADKILNSLLEFIVLFEG